jgi:hypothetical protein
MDQKPDFPKWIQDKYGYKYSVHDVSESRMNRMLIIRDDGERVANLFLTSFGDVLLLHDLFVNKFKTKKYSPWIGKLRYHFGLSPKKIPLRSRGLGKALLRIAKEFGEQYGFERIEGRITPGDREQTPYLIHFYRKSGFEVIESDGDWKLWLRI